MKSVTREKCGQVRGKMVTRPYKRKAINAEVVAGTARGYCEAHDDKDVRVIVLTGAGDKAFCAGADLQNSGAAFAMDFSRPNVDYADLLRLSQDATKPEIARIGWRRHGHWHGSVVHDRYRGCRRSRHPWTSRGQGRRVPDAGLSLLLTIAPKRLVNEWSLSGEPSDANAANDARLLNYGVSAAKLEAKVHWLISRIADKSPTAIRRCKYVMRAIPSMSFDGSIAYTESQIALLAMTENAKEGLKPFGEKRKPSWSGK